MIRINVIICKVKWSNKVNDNLIEGNIVKSLWKNNDFFYN